MALLPRLKFFLFALSFVFVAPFVLAFDPYYLSDAAGVYLTNSTGTTTVYTPPGNWSVDGALQDGIGNLYVSQSCTTACSPKRFQIVKNNQVIYDQTSDFLKIILTSVDIHDNVYFIERSATPPSGDTAYKIDPQGTQTAIHHAIYGWLLGLAGDSEGNFYTILHPNSQVIFITKNGNQILFYQTSAFTINFSGMTIDSRDKLYFSNAEKIYRVDSGSPTLLYSDPSGYIIRSISTDSAQNVYATSACDPPTVPACNYNGNFLQNGTVLLGPVSNLRNISVLPVLPVLLVHGIYSDDTIWNTFQSTYLGPVYTVGALLGQPGLIPNNDDISKLAVQEKKAIDVLKTQTGYKKIDVVAHSMGGLVTREYIANDSYQNDIRKLIMLGTPNEGAHIATTWLSLIFGYFSGGNPLNPALYQLDVNSTFITKLNLKNNNAHTKNVHYFAIAGNQLTSNHTLLIAICSVMPTFCTGTITDSIVPMSSVNFIGPCYETNVTHTASLGPTYYNTQLVLNQVERLLQQSTTILPPCSVV